MGTRLSGLLLILRALAPVLIVLILGGTLAIVLGDVRAAVDEPLELIGGEIEEVRTTVASVSDDIEAVSAQVTTLVGALNGLNIPNIIPNIPANLQFPTLDPPAINIPVPTVSMSTSNTTIAGVTLTYPSGLTIGSTNFSLNIPNIGGFAVPLPGLSEIDDVLRNALSGVNGVFSSFRATFSSVGQLVDTLQLVPDHMTTIAEQSEQLANNVRAVVRRWGETLLLVTVILLVLVVIYIGVPVLDDLTRGWRMLRGLPPEGV
jgi:hypothetical protein